MKLLKMILVALCLTGVALADDCEPLTAAQRVKIFKGEEVECVPKKESMLEKSIREYDERKASGWEPPTAVEQSRKWGEKRYQESLKKYPPLSKEEAFYQDLFAGVFFLFVYFTLMLGLKIGSIVSFLYGGVGAICASVFGLADWVVSIVTLILSISALCVLIYGLLLAFRSYNKWQFSSKQ